MGNSLVIKDYMSLEDIDLEGKSVLLRIDVNSPMDPISKRILDDSRFKSHAPTFNSLKNSKVAVLAHQSRPGKKDFTPTKKHAKKLSDIIDHDVKYVDDIFGSRARKEIKKMENGDILFLENVRFYSEEVIERNMFEQKNTYLVKKLSPLFDYFVFDAFAASHRMQPSVIGFPQTIPSAIGKLMQKELRVLNQVKKMKNGASFVLGGIKVDDSLEVIQNLLSNKIAKKVFVTGVIANIFLLASGIDIGKSNKKFINDLGYGGQINKAERILEKFDENIEIPEDVAINKNGNRENIPVTNLPVEENIEDIGIETIAGFDDKIQKSETIVVNGPAGVFEKEEFSIGTEELLRSVSNSDAFSIIGGGHVLTAAEELGLKKHFDHVSTGGGALMRFFSSESLPVLSALQHNERYNV